MTLLLNMLEFRIVWALSLCFLAALNQGESASCLADGNEVIELLTGDDDVTVITNIPVVPRCIQCGYIIQSAPLALVYVTDPDEVTYFDVDSNPIMNGSIDGVTIFHDGLLVEEPANSFSNDDNIQCRFSDGSNTMMTYTITFIITAFLPPPITPNGTVLDYVEGDNVTLTCTGNDILNDRYQWTLPDGSTIPPNPTNADNGLDVELKNVNRTDSGVYNCTGTIVGESISVVSSVTLNIQFAPDPVAVFRNGSSPNSITLSWSYGVFNGSAPITGVDITYTATSNYGNGLNMGDESGSISTDQLSLTIPNLQPLTTYQFSITVNNSVSDTVGSSSTITVSADTLPIAPYAPTSVNVTAIDSTSVTVTWTANVNSFIQTPLLGFVLEYNILGNSTVEHIIISNGIAKSNVVSGLRKDTTYQVQVQSANSAGASPFSDPVQGRTDIDGSTTEVTTTTTLPVWIPVTAVVGGGLTLFLVVAVILVIMVVCIWRVIKTPTKSRTVAAVTGIYPSNDVMVDGNSAYGTRDTLFTREQQKTTGNEVIYEPPIVSQNTTTAVSPTSDIVDNSAYGMRDTRSIREQVIYEPPIVAEQEVIYEQL